MLTRGPAVVVIGGANIDRKGTGLEPLRPATSNPVRWSESDGGVARNVAENLARLGVPVGLVAAVGADAAGRALRQRARAHGIDVRGVIARRGLPTGSYTALLHPGGEMAMAASDMQAVESLVPARLAALRRCWGDAAWRVVDLNLPADSVAAQIAAVRSGGGAVVAVAVSVPKMRRLPERLDGLAVMILNADELAAATGLDSTGRDGLAEGCRRLCARGAGAVVVTAGAAGVGWNRGDALHWRPAPPSRPVDVTGAGDAFSAGVVASLYRHGPDLDRACAVGQRLAVLALESALTVAPAVTPAVLDAPVEPSNP